ncbi:hypothetical protein BDR04DRAFT_1148919 [Suillus decipiens]|nr:hypothetical protein BDR04DRAFT_1148919 [Suillus decipiens]
MSTENNPGSRPPAKILTDDFRELERVDNKSRQKFWKCNYCTPTSGSRQRIEGRDNRFARNEAPKENLTAEFVCGQMPNKKTNNLSPVAPEVIKTVLYDPL